MNKHQNLISEQEQAKLYLVHHMHHLKSFFGAKHELHHCFLYSQKDMKGEKFEIKHFLPKNGRLLHVLDKFFLALFLTTPITRLKSERKKLTAKIIRLLDNKINLSSPT